MSSYYAPLETGGHIQQNPKRKSNVTKKVALAVIISVLVGVIIVVIILTSPTSYKEETPPTEKVLHGDTTNPPTTAPPTRATPTRATQTSAPTTKAPTTKAPTTKAPTIAPTNAPTAPIPIPRMPQRDDASLKLVFAAIGDWGVTPNLNHDSTTGGDRDKKRDFDAQKNIAKYLNLWAQQNKPEFVLSHGDNFYWTGVQSIDDERWRSLFEEMYNDPALHVPWYNVLGNHDLGGASGFCGPSCWSCGDVCDNVQLMEEALNKKFTTQRDYVSPNKNRWKLPSHYYAILHYYPDERTAEFTVEIFNIDTNAAGDRLPNTCCQCYAPQVYKGDCDNPGRGNQNCINGNTEQYDKCSEILTSWWDESMENLKVDLKNSGATWKIVHNHYLMKHFTPAQQKQVREILEEGEAHVLVGAHEHAEGHDLINGIHYLENGGGGGAVMLGGTGNVWHKMTYGFMTGKFSKDWLQVQFHDDSGELMHCYNIPQNRGLSKAPDAITKFRC